MFDNSFLGLTRLNKILINQKEVIKRKKAIIFLNIISQSPGLGIIFISLGKKRNNIKGDERPNPINKRIENISIIFPDKAKPIAVPTRGAVQLRSRLFKAFII